MSTRRAFFSPAFAGRFGKGWLFAGFLFLYLPIVSLVFYSFNASSLPSVWTGFTLDWYRKLATDREMLSGLWLSLEIAFLTACGSVLLGTLAAFSLVKYKRFTGRTLFSGMVSAPLVMPEVIIGLSLLLMLVAVQKAFDAPDLGPIGHWFVNSLLGRGLGTIWLGHMLLCTAYATVVVQARLQDMPASLEEAALDLGAKPFQVFALVTLPMISQALAAAWLLTFSLSLDDVVISNFLNGPGSTTLPLVIFSRARLGLNPSVNAMATVIIAIVAICVTLGSLYIARAERRRAAEMNAAQRGT
jgi:putrescine transport system permease protein